MQLGLERAAARAAATAPTRRTSTRSPRTAASRRLPLAAASSLMAKGYGYGAEGDALTAALMSAGARRCSATRSSPRCTRWTSRSDSILMSHMGEGNWALARDDRPVRLIKRPLGHRRARRPADVPVPVRDRPGDAGHAGLARRRALPAASSPRARSSTPTSCRRSRCPTASSAPTRGVRECMDAWLRLGGPHHQVLNPGPPGGRRGGRSASWPAWSSRWREPWPSSASRRRARSSSCTAGRQRRSSTEVGAGCARGASAGRSCWPRFAAGEPDDAFRGRGARPVAQPACATGATPSTAPSTASSSPSPSAATRCTASSCRALAGRAHAPHAACARPTSCTRGRAIRSRWRSRSPTSSASGGVVMTLHATNVGAERAPFGAGLHPYLTPGARTSTTGARGPGGARACPSTSGCCRRARRRRSTGPSSTSAAPAASARCAWTRASASSAAARPASRASGSARHAGAGQLTVWMDERFRFVQVFTADAAIAVEPMTCAPDAFNSGDGLVVLEPGASFTGRCGLIAAGF